MVSSMQQILPIVWNTLTESAALYPSLWCRSTSCCFAANELMMNLCSEPRWATHRRRTSQWFLNRLSTYVRTEVNYTEEVDDPVDSDGELNRLHAASWVASHFTSLAVALSVMSPSAGEVLGFENLVFSIFDFVHTLLENNKFKSTVKKALPDLIYYIILYMQITEEQVRTRPLPRELRPALAASARARSTARTDCLPNAPTDQSVDSEPAAVCGGRGRRHFLLLGQDFCPGSADGEIQSKDSQSGPDLSRANWQESMYVAVKLQFKQRNVATRQSSLLFVHGLAAV